MKLPDSTKINEHAIKLGESKLSPYSLIYSLSLVEFETLKIYIKTYQKIRFFSHFKSSVRVPILFHKKPAKNLCACFNYQGLSNQKTKTCYQLSVIDKLLDKLR